MLASPLTSSRGVAGPAGLRGEEEEEGEKPGEEAPSLLGRGEAMAGEGEGRSREFWRG